MNTEKSDKIKNVVMEVLRKVFFEVYTDDLKRDIIREINSKLDPFCQEKMIYDFLVQESGGIWKVFIKEVPGLATTEMQFTIRSKTVDIENDSV